MAEVLGDDIHIDTCLPSSGSVLVELTRLAPKTVTKQGNWPKRANILSGKLRSKTPNLRAEGIHVEEGKKTRVLKDMCIYILYTAKAASSAFPTPSRHVSGETWKTLRTKKTMFQLTLGQRPQENLMLYSSIRVDGHAAIFDTP